MLKHFRLEILIAKKSKFNPKKTCHYHEKIFEHNKIKLEVILQFLHSKYLM